MPAFSFDALDAQGQTRKGLMEADTAKAARSLLRAQALVPLAVEPVQTGQSLPQSTRSAPKQAKTCSTYGARSAAVAPDAASVSTKSAVPFSEYRVVTSSSVIACGTTAMRSL